MLRRSPKISSPIRSRPDRLPRALAAIMALLLAAGTAGAGGPDTARRPSPPAGSRASLTAVAAVRSTAASGDTAVDAPAPAPTINPDCRNAADPIARADELMANVYRLGAHPGVRLPADPSWTENPLHDTNWQFQFHSLRYVLDLLTASRQTGRTAYETRAIALVRDWSHDNPRLSAPSIWAWNDHATAQRAVVLACFADLLPMTDWLGAALVLHGRTLADPAFYREHGNHALNQDIGLLEVARVLSRADWLALAGDRMNTLVLDSVDAQGVTNEQSIGYQDFNYKRYRVAEARMLAVGLTPGAGFARVARMPAFLAQATLPSGGYTMIGDTSGWPADAIPGTDAEYAATGGTSGTQPTTTIARYTAGYLFARSGWGGPDRAAADETMFSLRWGPGPVFHGHADGLSLTLAAWGSRLLEDPGAYSYGGGAMRWFVKRRPAHNIVTVDGSTWASATSTRLLSYRQSTRFVDIRLRAAGDPGVTHTRRVTWSRSLDYLLVDDVLTSATLHAYRQLWHLGADARPSVGVATVTTQRARGNVQIRQLAGAPTLRIVTGATAPVQGWLSYRPGAKVAAPVVEAVQRGRTVRYLTLIVPAAGRPSATVSGVRLTADGYTVRITIGGRSELVTVSGASVWIHDLP